MARLTTAILCDHAQVRGGLLFVLSGGISRLNRPELPSPIMAQLAVVMEFQPDEIALTHEIRVTVQHAETLKAIVTVTGGIQVGEVPELLPGEPLQVPMVIPQIAAATVEAEGAYDIRVTIDDEPPVMLPFYVVKTGSA